MAKAKAKAKASAKGFAKPTLKSDALLKQKRQESGVAPLSEKLDIGNEVVGGGFKPNKRTEEQLVMKIVDEKFPG